MDIHIFNILKSQPKYIVSGFAELVCLSSCPCRRDERPEHRDARASFAVVVAALHESTEAVLYLMGKKVNMQSKSFDNLTPFQIAAKYVPLQTSL